MRIANGGVGVRERAAALAKIGANRRPVAALARRRDDLEVVRQDGLRGVVLLDAAREPVLDKPVELADFALGVGS